MPEFASVTGVPVGTCHVVLGLALDGENVGHASNEGVVGERKKSQDDIVGHVTDIIEMRQFIFL